MPFANLLLSMLQALGVEAESFADSEGPLEGFFCLGTQESVLSASLERTVVDDLPFHCSDLSSEHFRPRPTVGAIGNQNCR